MHCSRSIADCACAHATGVGFDRSVHNLTGFALPWSGKPALSGGNPHRGQRSVRPRPELQMVARERLGGLSDHRPGDLRQCHHDRNAGRSLGATTGSGCSKATSSKCRTTTRCWRRFPALAPGSVDRPRQPGGDPRRDDDARCRFRCNASSAAAPLGSQGHRRGSLSARTTPCRIPQVAGGGRRLRKSSGSISKTAFKIEFADLHEPNYRSGDYWLIPARVATGDVIWPIEVAEDAQQNPDQRPVARRPDGVLHHFATAGAGDARRQSHQPDTMQQRLARDPRWKTRIVGAPPKSLEPVPGHRQFGAGRLADREQGG